MACKRPEETTALSIIKASVHNACPAISAALAWTFLEFFASKVLSGIFEEGTFFGEVMLGSTLSPRATRPQAMSLPLQ